MPDNDNIPASLTLAAGLSWRFLAVAAAVSVIALGIAKLAIIVLPLSAALLLATQLMPPIRWLKAHGWPNAVAAIVVLVTSLVVLATIGAALVPAVIAQRPQFMTGLQSVVATVSDWLATGQFGLPKDVVQRSLDQIGGQVGTNAGLILTSVFVGANGLLQVVFGAFLTLFLLFFFLIGGDAIWEWTVQLFPDRNEQTVRGAGARAWKALAGYVRGVAMVGLTEGVILGLVLWIAGVPVALPLAVLVFVGAAIPIAGLGFAGVLAALITLVTNGPGAGLIVLAIVLAVGQLEGPVIRPLFVGHAVSLHPIAVLLTVAAGAVVWGVAGAFLALPLTMLVVALAAELHGEAPPAA